MATDYRAIDQILAMHTIAVVGLSKDPSRPSHEVASYLQKHGYRIVPINPTVDEVLGEKAYPSLLDLPESLKREIDVVDIFRRTEDVPPIVAEAIKLHAIREHPKAVWMQLGIVNEDSARQARDAGLLVVMDRCLKIERGRRQ
ncbi:MAG TPA: CoA-binding protein [archaeon]|nr:CoA-binding protein [archaeon]